MEEVPRAYQEWADMGETERADDFQAYVRNIAEARYVLRRVARLINERAKAWGFDPLVHQAVLQIYGSSHEGHLSINGLADRLDVPAAFASRLVNRLESEGLARRESSRRDRRITLVSLTEEGVRVLKAIDAEVHHHVATFQRQLTEADRVAAMSIFAFYVGIGADSPIAAAVRARARALRRQGPSTAT